jgi:hypothetical protein
MSLMALAEHYFRTQVAGQAEGTVGTKQRDLACFLSFYMQLYGHDDRREWYKAVTEAFLKALARGQVPRPSKRGEAKPQRLSQSTIARTYAAVRHFARWIDPHVAAFPYAMELRGIAATGTSGAMCGPIPRAWPRQLMTSTSRGVPSLVDI